MVLAWPSNYCANPPTQQDVCQAWCLLGLARCMPAYDAQPSWHDTCLAQHDPCHLCGSSKMHASFVGIVLAISRCMPAVLAQYLLQQNACLLCWHDTCYSKMHACCVGMILAIARCMPAVLAQYLLQQDACLLCWHSTCYSKIRANPPLRGCCLKTTPPFRVPSRLARVGAPQSSSSLKFHASYQKLSTFFIFYKT